MLAVVFVNGLIQMFRYSLPLSLFIGLVVVLGLGLRLNPKQIPSPLIGQPIPAFDLPLISNQNQHFRTSDLLGEVWILNVWASWCVSCREEHQQLLNLQHLDLIKIVGINYKDNLKAGQEWLSTHGNPYYLSVTDQSGKTGIDLGVYGVPETYIIDKQGLIRYKHTGPISTHDLDTLLLPILKQIKDAS